MVGKQSRSACIVLLVCRNGHPTCERVQDAPELRNIVTEQLKRLAWLYSYAECIHSTTGGSRYFQKERESLRWFASFIYVIPLSMFVYWPCLGPAMSAF